MSDMKQQEEAQVQQVQQDIETAKQEASPGFTKIEKTENPPRRRNNWLAGLVGGTALLFAILFPTLWFKLREGKSFEMTEAPFNASLPFFTENITRGYATSEELRGDLESVAWFSLNNIVKDNVERDKHRRGDGGRSWGPGWFGTPRTADGPMDESIMIDTTTTTEGDSSSSQAGEDGVGAKEDGNDEYGTNNQEDGVEEGDLIVSDGKRVYAAYGEYFLVWDATTGKMLAQVEMPSLETMHKSIIPTEMTTRDNNKRGSQRPYYYGKPDIRSLLLRDDRLLVIVSGYGTLFRPAGGRLPILRNYLGTHVRVYDASAALEEANGTLPLMGAENVNGRFHGVRSVDGNAHVITIAEIDTYSHLVAPFARSEFRHASSDREYIEQVRKLAEEKVVSDFASGLIAELRDGGGGSNSNLPKLARISLWHTPPSVGSPNPFAFRDGVVNSIAQVSSFDLTSTTPQQQGDDKLEISTCGCFVPSYWPTLYGSSDRIIIAGEGWEYDRARKESVEATYMIGLSIDKNGALANLHSVGKVVGRVLNSHSIDVLDNVLRIATTVSRWRPFFVGPAVAAEDVSTMSESTAMMEFDPDSSTANYVTLLEMPGMDGREPGVMVPKSRLKLGKPNERFTAVRYFDNIAYAVTFERTDPFYVLNLTAVEAPEVVAELNITGFSSYLHSMNGNNSLILAIGQEADHNGVVLGLQITIFDVRVPSKPRILRRHVIERDRNVHSSSDSLWDFKAVRYSRGRLIFPVDIDSWKDKSLSFHGFVVFTANENAIEEECRISTDKKTQYGGYVDGSNTAVEEDTADSIAAASSVWSGGGATTGDYYHAPSCRYCGGYLPRRSMIFGGASLMTTHDSYVKSTNLTSCQGLWELDVSIDEEGCCRRHY